MTDEEAATFLAAALALLPKELGLAEHLHDLEHAPQALRAALQALWQQTGTRSPAPAAMPQHPLAAQPWWRRFWSLQKS